MCITLKTLKVKNILAFAIGWIIYYDKYLCVNETVTSHFVNTFEAEMILVLHSKCTYMKLIDPGLCYNYDYVL